MFNHMEHVDPALKRKMLEEEAARRKLPLPAITKRQMLEEEAARRGLLTYKTFGEFVYAMEPHLTEHDYMQRQIAVAEKVLAGMVKRLLVLLPTQYGKSTLWSKLLPAYYLRKHPSRWVGLASYSADLAWNLSGDARDYYTKSGGHFKEGTLGGSARNWRTLRSGGASGGMWAAGIGSSALGKGWNLGIVDDPMHPEQVVRSAYIRRFVRWWPSQWVRGQRAIASGGNACVFVMQRLAIDDPVAWLLEREETDAKEGWHILAMDEIHSDEPYGRWDGPLGFPKTCTVEPDPRKIGEVLAPKFRTEPEVLAMQAQTGSITTAAQRQQRPMRPTGDFWALKWFKDRVYDVLPPDAIERGWDFDTAYTKEEENSATAGILSFRSAGPRKECKIYIEDVFWDWLEFPDVIKQMHVLIGPFFVEKKASGKSIVQVLKTHDIIAEEVPVMGDKLARSAAVQPVVSVGRVYINKVVWQKLLFGEGQGLLRITAEALVQDRGGLDVNDAFVQALTRHTGLGAAEKKKLAFG